MTKPKIGDIIKFLNNIKEEEHFLVLSASKKEKSLGYPVTKCDLLNLKNGNIQKYAVYYTMKYWIKVA